MLANKPKAVCAICGDPLRQSNYKACPKHAAEYRHKVQKERYDFRKQHGACVRCAKPAEPGNIRCAECIEINRKNGEQYYQRHPEEAKERARASVRRKRAGIEK